MLSIIPKIPKRSVCAFGILQDVKVTRHEGLVFTIANSQGDGKIETFIVEDQEIRERLLEYLGHPADFIQRVEDIKNILENNKNKVNSTDACFIVVRIILFSIYNQRILYDVFIIGYFGKVYPS